MKTISIRIKGLIVCTGTGSQAWFSSHRNLSTEQVSKVLKISSRYLKHIPQSEQLLTSLDEAQLTEISEAYLREFVHMDPCSSKMMFSVKDPLHNQVAFMTTHIERRFPLVF